MKDDSAARPARPSAHQGPGQAARARAEVRALLAAATPPPSERTAADALLVTSELVANALRHGGGLTGFDAALAGDRLVLVVADRSTRPPVPTHPLAPAPGTGGAFP
ncbi:ATP-binding protein, partial [Streptomyces solincola]|uniref:ATP-binding protein n=1 Tax=Streptomyces solincola TaxID=2100817 RepID=UPI00215922C2